MIGLALSLVLTTEADVAFRVTGTGLLKACSEQTTMQQAICGGYVSGVVDQEIVANIQNIGKLSACVPQTAGIQDLVPLVVATIRSDPKTFNDTPAALAVQRAISANYPCTETAPRPGNVKP